VSRARPRIRMPPRSAPAASPRLSHGLTGFKCLPTWTRRSLPVPAAKTQWWCRQHSPTPWQVVCPWRCRLSQHPNHNSHNHNHNHSHSHKRHCDQRQHVAMPALTRVCTATAVALAGMRVGMRVGVPVVPVAAALPHPAFGSAVHPICHLVSPSCMPVPCGCNSAQTSPPGAPPTLPPRLQPQRLLWQPPQNQNPNQNLNQSLNRRRGHGPHPHPHPPLTP